MLSSLRAKIATVVVSFGLFLFGVPLAFATPPPLPERNIGKLSEAAVVRENQIWWLALAIYREAGYEPLEGRIKVAEVVLRRVIDERWPNTVQKVVRQGEHRRNRCQFSFMCDGKPDKVTSDSPKVREAWIAALRIARKAYTRWKQHPESIGCAHSYIADYAYDKGSKHRASAEAREWFGTLKRDEKIGVHIFFCDAPPVPPLNPDLPARSPVPALSLPPIPERAPVGQD